MARLIYSAIMSLDGYTADADGRFEWAAPDEEVHAFVNDSSGRSAPISSGGGCTRRWRLGDRHTVADQPPSRRLRADLAGGRQDRLFDYAPDAGHRQDPHRAGLRPGPGPQDEGSGRP